MDNLSIPLHPDLIVATDRSITDVAARDSSDLADSEDFAHFGMTLDGLLVHGFQQASHCEADFINQLIDDAVEPYIDLLLLRGCLRIPLRANVKAHNDSVGRRGK